MKRDKVEKKLKALGKSITVMLLGLFVFISCNERFENVLKEEYGDSGTEYKQGKVLLITIEGAAGKAVQQAVNDNRAPTIKAILENSMHTFEGLADSRVNLSHISADRAWANLLTGVTTHNVGESIEHLEDMEAPSFLALMNKTNKKFKTSLFSANETIVSVLENDVDTKLLLQNDDEVTDAVSKRLSSHEEEIPDILIAQLEGVNQSGLEKGFYEEDGSVQNNIIEAIQDVDEQINEMYKALQDRPNFTKENWLVIITSIYGGVFEGEKEEGTFYDDPERNTFTALYSPRFESKLLQASNADIRYNYFSPWYSGSGATESAKVIDPSLFNMGSRSTDSTSYTIQFMLYDTWPDAGSGHTILSKRARVNDGPGWNLKLHSQGGNVATSLETSVGWGGFNWYQVRKNNPWRVYTFIFKECGETDSLISYLDGVEYARQAIGNNEMSNDEPLTIGKIVGSSEGTDGHFFVNNVQFYDVALPPEYLAENYCRTRLDQIEDFEYWDNLLGYWPNDREENFGGRVLPDYSKYGSIYEGENAGRSDMVLTQPTWEDGSMIDPNVCPEPEEAFFREVFNTVDIPFQIMTWFGVVSNSQWTLEGIGWPFQYQGLEN